jgi:hypothetical protein
MDSTTVLAQLSQAGSDSRQLDRICIQVAAALVEDGVEPDFDVASADFEKNPFLICADRFWQRRLIDNPSISTAAACARWMDKHVAELARPEIEQRWALGNAFVTRDSVESRTEVADATAKILADRALPESAAYFAAMYHAGKLRANRMFDELRSFLESSPLAAAAGSLRNDAAFVAMLAFASFGSRAMSNAYAAELLEQAWNASGRTRQVTDVCLAAIAEAVPFDAQGEMLVEHSAQAVAAYPTDHLFWYRLASGLHLCQRPDEALRAIDDALRLLPAIGARISHQVLQQQYLTKREAILEGRLRSLWAAEQQRRWDEQEEANTAIREIARSSAVRAVELVAIFTAAIAFAVGSLQVTLNGTLALHDRIWLLITLGAGLAVFALLTIGGTWYITRREHKPRPRARSR